MINLHRAVVLMDFIKSLKPADFFDDVYRQLTGL